ncbi:LysR family transcriptional regulator [Thioclava sp. FR2]|uniref:LysR family transcriptional regulator n=1 Tax=Thioclava sp. FR2 TaxID=3445780 RepID=UPI003EC04994
MQIFQEVARHLSYTRAAESLNLTQPAVFTQVRQLEDQVGMALIERLGRRLFLTEAGEVVLRSARDLLGELEQMEMRLADLSGMARGRLRIGIVSTAKYDIPRRLGEFCRAHPGIDVSLTVGNREELLGRFAENEDDLYILGTPPEGLDAESHRFAENPLVMVAPPDHRLAGKPVQPTDLATEAFVMREQGSGTRIAAERWFKQQGIEPLVRMELGANEAIKQAVMAGLGLSVLSRGSALLELEQGYLTELALEDFPLLRHWHVAWPQGKRLSVGALAFLDILFGKGCAPVPKALATGKAASTR